MGKTNRYEPRNGQFKMLKASKQKRNKKQRQSKANLTRDLKFASKHRSNTLDITQGRSAAMYMENDNE